MTTDISVILDRSGSMQHIADDTIGGFNRFLRDQQQTAGEATLSLFEFDHEYHEVFAGRPIRQVPLLSRETFVPRGSTALLDAIGKTIGDTGARLDKLADGQKPGVVIMVIITDGQENASRTFTRQAVNLMITHQREKYQWQFVFLGANQDAIAVASDMGILRGNALTYAVSPQAVAASYGAVGQMVNSMRGGDLRAKFSDKERVAAMAPDDPWDQLHTVTTQTTTTTK